MGHYIYYTCAESPLWEQTFPGARNAENGTSNITAFSDMERDVDYRKHFFFHLVSKSHNLIEISLR